MNLKLLLPLVLAFFLLQQNVTGQCACAGTDYGSINVAGWIPGQSGTIATNIYAGERSLISNTVAGATYRISSCGSSYDTQLSIYTQACVSVAYNDDNGPSCTGTSASVNAVSPGGNLYAKLNQYNCATNSTNTTVTVTLLCLPNAGNPSVFGSNTWNVYGYNGNDVNLGGGAVYQGFYSESNLSYSSTNRWNTNASPSSATGWGGCAVNADNHTVVSKRQGVPIAGVYAVSVNQHDDNIRFLVNGTNQLEIGYCCNVHNDFYAGYFDGSTTMEMRHGEGGGGSNQGLTFTQQVLNATVNVTNLTEHSVCVGNVGAINFSNPTGAVASPVFKSDFSSGTGITLSGSASLTGGNLQLTPNAGGQIGGAIFANSTNMNASQFRAEFDFRVWDGGGADGFSFNYADMSGSPANTGEGGFGNGLTLSFVTYSGAGGPYVSVKYAGTTYYTAYPAIRDAAFRKAVVTVNASNQLTLTIGGTVIFNNVSLPAAFQSTDKTNWRFSMAGRTGGVTDSHWIDNLWINAYNQYEYSIDGGTWNTTGSFTGLAPGTYNPRVRNRAFTAYPQILSPVTITQPAAPNQGTAGTYGTNEWYVSCYRSGGLTNYTGFYKSARNNEFNVGADGMGVTSNPTTIVSGTINGAAVTGYSGCYSGWGNDNWSFDARRTGFTCGVYQLEVMGNDDNYTVEIDYDGNGTFDVTRNGTCCNGVNLGNVGATPYVLNSNSRIRITLVEGTGDAYLDVNLNLISPAALAGGTISGISNGATVCTGSDPGSFGTSGAASGGAGTAYLNGTYTYDWESSTTSAASGFSSLGVATQTYDPGALTQTTWFRRKVTDKCGNVAYSNVVQVVINNLAVAPTSISGSSTICIGESTTLTSVGGANNGDAIDVWYLGGCVTEAYDQGWLSQPFSTNQTTVNSVANGILNVTSTGIDPMITMGGLGNFDPVIYRYIQIRYRVTAGTPLNAEIFFFNSLHLAQGGESAVGTLIADGNWHILNIDMQSDPDYTSNGNITGWRFDWCAASGVTMDIDFITLANKPMLETGPSITVSPTTNPTYYSTAKKGACNLTACATQMITINSLPAITSATAAANPICANATTTLTANGVAGTGATVTWWTGAGGTGTNLGTGTSITAGPGTYYARVTGSCTPAVEAGVTVGSLVIPAITSVTATSNQICASATTTVTANGVAGDGAVVTWWTGAGGTGSNLGTGTSITAGPGTYYARVTGTCGPAVEANTTVNIAIPDYTHLSSPTSTSVENCSSFTVMGMVNEVGITGAGQGPGIDAEFGYSNANTDPSTWTTWSAATYHSNSAFGDDRYSFNFTPPSTGTYYYTFRYRLNGCDWTIAGTPGGASGWNGTTNNSGSVTVTPYDFFFTNLQFPATATIDACSNMTAYGRVNEPGLTVGATANPLVLVEFGYNNANTDPATWTNWSSATFNTQTAFGDHEYRADFTTTVPGTYYYTFRYRHSTCSSDWQYGGYNGGTWNGTTNVNGQVTVNAIIDWANLQWPPDATVCLGSSFDAYGQIYEPFVTDGPGQGAGVSVEFGYNATDTDPSTWTTWATASYNTLYSGSINNDEYMYNFTAPSTGTYYYTFRYRMNPLCQWQYGGYNVGGGGFWNGTTNVNGILTVIDPSATVALASSSVASVGSCDDGVWTYYKDNNDNFVFAINWAPDGSISAANAAAKAASSVDISVGAMTSVTTTSYGTWVMGRYWNVNAPGFDEAVDVRFYYDPAEKTAVENAMTGFTSASSNVIDEGFMWFKTVSGPYSPAIVDYNGVDPYNTIELTGTPGTENGVTFVQFDGLSSFSGGSGATGVGKGNALPVELLYFTGTKQEAYNHLKWATETEQNTAYFDIERSKDGVNFQAIGREDAAGNSNATLLYSFDDERPLAGVSYYRLRMVDIDGSVKFSNVISLERTAKGTELVGLFPNPANAFLNYELLAENDDEISVRLLDNFGRLISTETVQVSTGQNVKTMDISQLSAGMYYLSISCCDGKVINQKFVKQ